MKMKNLKNLWIDLTWEIRVKYYEIFDCYPTVEKFNADCSTEYHTDNI